MKEEGIDIILNFLQRIKTTGLIVVAHLNFLSSRREKNRRT